MSSQVPLNSPLRCSVAISDKHLLQVHLRLLRLLTQELDGPLLALAKECKERVEQLVARHTRHALVLAFFRLVLCAL
jgi:hypothetical protein